MQRRDFVRGGAVGLALATIPLRVKAVPVNTFTEGDTVQQRLEKFNQLTGAGLSFGFIDVRGEYVKTEKFYGENSRGRRCLIFRDGHATGLMDKETFMHWTAQVALGYRMRMEQE